MCDTISIFKPYFFGLLYVVVIGHIMVRINVDAMRELLVDTSGSNNQIKQWPVTLIGTLERIAFYFSILIEIPHFIAFIIGIKSAAHWANWKLQKSSKKIAEESLKEYRIFLIGSLLSVFYGVLGGYISKLIIFYTFPWYIILIIASSNILFSIIIWIFTKLYISYPKGIIKTIFSKIKK